MPVGDASEQMLALLCLFVENGYLIMDDEVGEPAGDLEPYVESGLLNRKKAFPLSLLERSTYEQNCAEVAFMAHNMVLTMQAMGLGGLYFSGINELSLFGTPTADDIEGLGFRFVENEDWTLPNPVIWVHGRLNSGVPGFAPCTDSTTLARAKSPVQFSSRNWKS